MAVEFISDVVVTSSADASSAAVTVPADADCVVIGIGGWKSGTIFPPTTLTLGGNAFTSLQSANNNSFDKIQLSRLVAPATGAQTFAWDIAGSGTISEGLLYMLAFFKGVDQSDPIVASGLTTGASDVASLGSPDAGDMMVGFSVSFDTAVTVTGSSQTSLSTPARFNSAFLRGAYKAGANVYDISGGDEFNCHAACVLRAAAAGGVTGDASTTAPAQASTATGTLTAQGAAVTAAPAQTSAATATATAQGAAATAAPAQISDAAGTVAVNAEGAAATSAPAQITAATGSIPLPPAPPPTQQKRLVADENDPRIWVPMGALIPLR